MSGDVGWIYWDETGTATGPIGLNDVAGLVRSGRISPNTDMRRPSEVAWKPAFSLLPDLFPGHAIEAAPTTGWTDVRPHPWRRYAARMIDAFVVGSILWVLVGIIFYSLAPAAAAAFFRLFQVPGGQFLDIILTQMVVMPVNALTIGLTGLTLGKWIFGIRVSKDGAPIGFLKALRREGAVFVFGLGCGIPFASLFTLIGSYSQLRDDRTTSWDRKSKLAVSYRPESLAASIGMWAAVILFLTGRVWYAVLARAS
jgi:uncharacterized RDD family membrane protein YckC